MQKTIHTAAIIPLSDRFIFKLFRNFKSGTLCWESHTLSVPSERKASKEQSYCRMNKGCGG